MVALGLCVFLFCVLRSVLAQLDRTLEGRSPKRLLVAAAGAKVLPSAFAPRIRAVPGVRRVSPYFMFFGLLPVKKEGRGTGEGDWTNAFPNVAVEAEPYFAMNPELRIAPEQFRDFVADLRGCVVCRHLAEKFGWRIGDRFHLESVFPGLRKASGPF